MRIGSKVLVCGDKVREEGVFAFTDETWLVDRTRKSGRGGGNGTPEENGVRAVDGFSSFVVRSGFAIECLAVVCFEKDVGTFVDACVIEVKSSEAADVIDDGVQEVEFESAQVAGAVEARDGDCRLLEESNLVVECGETLFCSLAEDVV